VELELGMQLLFNGSAQLFGVRFPPQGSDHFFSFYLDMADSFIDYSALPFTDEERAILRDAGLLFDSVHYSDWMGEPITVKGLVLPLNITIGGLNIPNQPMLLGINHTETVYPDTFHSSVIGLAFQELSSLKKPTLMTSLWESGQLERNAFSLVIPSPLYPKQVGSPIGRLFLGGIPALWIEEPIHVHPVVSSYEQPGYWGLNLTNFQIGADSLLGLNNYAILSTTTSFVMVPQIAFDLLIQLFTPILPSGNVVSYPSGLRAFIFLCPEVPASNFPPVTFFFDGVPYSMDPMSLVAPSTVDPTVCFLEIAGFDVSVGKGPAWIMGTAFFQKRAFMFDIANKTITIGRAPNN